MRCCGTSLADIIILVIMAKLKKQEVEKEKFLPKLAKNLSSEQYNICFLAGTEPPFSGKYTDNFDKGMYLCAVCKTSLFPSSSKFHSDSGWPSFDRVEDNDAVELRSDHSLGVVRVEVLCKNCGVHLGHLFDDGPTETHHRYCINSLALDFKSAK